MSKEFYMIVDTETTMDRHVCDIGIVITDRQGNIYQEKGFLLPSYSKEDLFHCKDGFFAKEGLEKRYKRYEEMLENGERDKVTIRALNKYLENLNEFYKPYLTAYNLGFDASVATNTDINLEQFEKRFCLWHLATKLWAKTRNYKAFIMEHHLFNNPTDKRNMTYKTNCEVMAHFLTGEDRDEPHTALEDAKIFELPILLKAVNRRKWKDAVNQPYSWEKFQVKNHFCPLMSEE